jgi:hypothetical protein
MKAKFYVGTASTALALAAAYAFVPPSATLAQDATLLAGKVVSNTGEALAGIPIKAHRDNSPITVAVYTDAKGEYSFPSWSDLTPGGYSVSVELPVFEHTSQHVAVSAGTAAKIDFTLKSKPLALKMRPPPRSWPACPAPTSRRHCLPNAAIATLCNGRSGSRATGRTGSGWSKRWRAAPPRT